MSEPLANDVASAWLARLEQAAPDADPGVLALALEARNCAVRRGDVEDAARMAVIDYSRPSTEKRMWVYDLKTRNLLYEELVAHGQGSGGNVPNAF